MSSMGYFADNLRNAFESKELSSFRVALDLGIDPAVMSKVLHGVRKPPKGFIESLASLEELGVATDTMYGWKALDEYSENQIYEAFKALCFNKKLSSEQKKEAISLLK
jgi:transcriptional regulator with XRE-family HTH domain